MGTGGDNRGLYGKSLADIVTAALGSPPYAADAYIDYMKATGNTILGLTKEIDHTDSPYTISDIDGISTLIIDTGTSDVTVNLPTLADNFGRRIKIINADGSNDVIVAPEGTEKINSYNANVPITEKWGWWEFVGSSDQWNGITDGKSTKYLGNSTSSINLSLTSNTWADVVTLELPAGFYDIEVAGEHYVEDTSLPKYFYLYMGLGVTTGNVVPSIRVIRDALYVDSQIMYIQIAYQKLNLYRYEVTATTTYRMKGMYLSDETPATAHYFSGSATSPIYIEAWRVA